MAGEIVSNAHIMERQMASLTSWIVGGLAFLLVVTVTGFAAAAWIVVDSRSSVTASQERSDQALACYIEPQLDRAEKTLPTLQYYKDNPKELAAQIKLIKQQRALTYATWGVCKAIPVP